MCIRLCVAQLNVHVIDVESIDVVVYMWQNVFVPQQLEEQKWAC